MVGFTRRLKRRSFKRFPVSRKIKSYVTKAIDRKTEDKQFAESLYTYFNSVPSAWTERELTAFAQGTAENQRIGRRIRLKSIELNGVVSQAAIEGLLDDYRNIMRIVIGQYTPGTFSPLSDASTDRDLPITRVIGTRGRLVRKFFDRVIPLQVVSTEKGGGDGYTPQLKQVKFYKRFKNGILINFSDDTVSYPDKKFVISMITDSAASPNPGFIQGYWKVTFEDA